MAKNKTNTDKTINTTEKSVENKMITQDIVRKTQYKSGKKVQTNAYKLAKMLADKRRKGNPVGRAEIVEKLGFDPAPYIKMYECFEAVDRGQYVYTGTALDELK